MQCRACGFENMPGSGHCARCGASLRLATAVIDVHPPRARLGATIQSCLLPFYRLWYAIQDALSQVIPVGHAPSLALPAKAWWRLALPGWPQIARERQRFGWRLFVSYLAILAGGTILFGTGIGAVLWGVAFAIHVASIQDGLFANWQSLRQRLWFGVLISALLFLIIYRPAFRQWNQFVAAVQIVQPLGEFQPGDVVWYRPGREPHIGEWIYFQLAPHHFAARRNAQLVIQGPWFGQVIALAGQSIEWNDMLLVDGATSEYVNPLSPHPQLPAQVVRDGYVAVVPAAEYSQAPIPASVQAGMMFVGRAQMEGTLLWRIYPFWRITNF